MGGGVGERLVGREWVHIYMYMYELSVNTVMDEAL